MGSAASAREVPDHTMRPFSRMRCRSDSRNRASTFLSMIRIERPSRLSAASRSQISCADQRRQPLGGLVQDQQLGVGHQGAADRQHLLLAARDLVAEVAAALGKPRQEGVDALQRPASAAPVRFAAVAMRFSSTVRVGKICRPSGTRPMPAWAMRNGGAPVDRPALEADLAGARGQQAHEGGHGGGLAHAVAAHQAHYLARADGEIDAEQHLRSAVAGLQPRDGRAGRLMPPRPGRRRARPGRRARPRACRWR